MIVLECIYLVSVSLIGFFSVSGMIGSELRFLCSSVKVFFVFFVLV